MQYTGVGYTGMNSSVCFVLKFALPPFAPALPTANFQTKQAQNQFHTRISCTGVQIVASRL